MTIKFYMASSWIVIGSITLAILGGFLYFGTEPAYLSWFENTNMREQHQVAYTIFAVLAPVLLFFFVYDFYRFISRQYVMINSKGIYDKISFKKFGYLPWKNISAVEIQTGKNGLAILAIYLDKPVRKKHLIKIGNLGITSRDVNRLSSYYPKVEKSNSLSFFG